MMFVRHLVPIPVVLMIAIAAHAACEEPVALPDTAGFAATIASFGDLAPPEQADRAARAAVLADPWLDDFTARKGKVPRSLATVLQGALLDRWSRQRYDFYFGHPSDLLAAAESDLADALASDPTHLPARVGRGLALLAAGEPEAGIAELIRALSLPAPTAADDGDSDVAALRASLRRTASWSLAVACCRLGLWDQAEAAAAMVGSEARRFKGPASLIHGLCLAGSGRTAEAIDWAVRMPPIKYPHTSSLGSGRYARPGSFGNIWIRSQALLAAGDPVGARGALGDIDDRRYQALPLGEAYWQDAGLVCELVGDPAARRCYERAHGRSPLWFARPTEGTTTMPLIFGFPAADVPFFTTGDGAFAGGSPFGYLARQMALSVEGADPSERDRARARALDCCAVLLRRHIRPDIVRAMRARLHLSTGCAELARPDLEFARAAFAAQGLVDPGTSQLLGLQELADGNGERAGELLAEALTAAPSDALGWRQLGVALSQAGHFAEAHVAMEKALALDPDSLAGWYNLGVLAWKSGDPRASLAHLERAWSLEPGNERVQFMLQTVAADLRRLAIGDDLQSGEPRDEEP